MPFHFSPHNYYLALWFNLGLIGLFTGCYLLFSAVGRARRASLAAAPPARGQLIAFVIGGIAVCTAVFFVDLYDPWFFFWMYTGVVMRVAFCVEHAPATEPVLQPTRLSGPARDPYGWSAAQGRR
jgi:hypothetical protein